MQSTSDIAVWGHAVPAWIARAIAGSGRTVTDVGGDGVSATAFPGARRHADIRTFAHGTRGMPLLCTELLSASDATLLCEGRTAIFSPEPLPAAACVGARPPRICLLPGLAPDGTLVQAAEAASESGGCRHALIETSASAEHGSMLARVADAARSMLMWMGMPDGVTCAISGARPARVREDSPDAASRAMAGFRGTLSCLLRYADSRGAAIVASVGSPTWVRHAHLQLADGTIVADDLTMARWDAKGALVERADSPTASDADPDVAVAAACLRGDAALERAQPESLTTRTAALVEAICLSGITGEWEEPARIEDILVRSSRFADD
jgi:hypothetical protein